MTAYVPSVPSFGQDKLRKSILICPGGAFVGHTEREMEVVALHFVAEGYCAFVLNYSIGAGVALLPGPLLDIGKAIGAIKVRERLWAIDPDEILLMGFSSGAYIAALYANLWHEKWLSQGVNLSNETLKCKGVVLAYPILDLQQFANRVRETLPEQAVVVEMMFSALLNTPAPPEAQFQRWHLLEHLSDQTLPTWIWAWSEDPLVNQDPLKIYRQKLLEHQVDCQLDFFSGDVHGSGINFGGNRRQRGTWFEALSDWNGERVGKSLPK